MSIDKVRIINTNLHQRVVVENTRDFDDQNQFEKSPTGMRSKSPQQTLKKLIKKGLVYYLKPYLRPQSSLQKTKQNFNLKTIKQPEKSTSMGKNSLTNKSFTSQYGFMCSKNHQTGRRNSTQFFRVKTQLSQSPSKYFYKKRNDQQSEFQTSFNAFRQFRNISEQTINRMNVENERKNFKLIELKKTKYQNLWKKHSIPDKNKQKCSTTFVSRVVK